MTQHNLSASMVKAKFDLESSRFYIEKEKTVIYVNFDAKQRKEHLGYIKLITKQPGKYN